MQADEGTDFKLVRRAIYSANEAGWIHLQFVVTKLHVEGAAAAGGGHG